MPGLLEPLARRNHCHQEVVANAVQSHRVSAGYEALRMVPGFSSRGVGMLSPDHTPLETASQ